MRVGKRPIRGSSLRTLVTNMYASKHTNGRSAELEGVRVHRPDSHLWERLEAEQALVSRKTQAVRDLRRTKMLSFLNRTARQGRHGTERRNNLMILDNQCKQRCAWTPWRGQAWLPLRQHGRRQIAADERRELSIVCEALLALAQRCGCCASCRQSVGRKPASAW